MELLTDPQAWLAFATLVALELVLGIDNIIFISILADKLPAARREAIRRLGLLLAMVMRIALLAVLAWLVGLTEPLFHVLRHPVSGRDLILLAGGLGVHVPKGYVYFAMAFSVLVEMLTLRLRRKAKPVRLRDAYRNPP